MNDFWIKHSNPGQWLIDVMAFCVIWGAIDYCRGSHRPLGKSFEKGFLAFGAIFPAMTGIIVLIPVFATWLAPGIGRIYALCGADPAMFAGSFLANDMGGYQLAEAMTSNPDAAGLSGMLLGSMLGVNFVFNLPVALAMISRENRVFLARGTVIGLITIPLGVWMGGVIAGISPVFILRQLLLPAAAIAIIVLLFVRFQSVGEKCFVAFGRMIQTIALTGTALTIFAELTGLKIPGIAPVSEGLRVVGSIIIVLPGAYVLAELLNRGLKPLFTQLAARCGIDDNAVSGMVTSAVNLLPALALVEKMSPRGKTAAFAFFVSGGFMLGDHLAFCGAVAPELLLPLVAGKAVAAASATAIAIWWGNRTASPSKQ